MNDEQRSNEVERIDKRNKYAMKNYGHLPTDDLILEDYINRTIIDAIKIDYHQGVCDAYRNLALHYIVTDSSVDAFELLQKIERLIDTYELDEINTMYLYSAYLVYYLEFIGDLKMGTKYALKGLELAEKLNNKDMIMRLKSNLGVINIQLGYLDSAKDLLNTSLDYYLSIDDEFHSMYVYNNLAEVYLKLDDIKKSKAYYDKALELAIAKDELTIRLDSSCGLAQIYAKERHFSDAIEIMNTVIDYLRQCKNVKFEIEASIQLAKIYIMQGIDKAAYSILKSVKIQLNEIENQKVILDFYKLLAEVAKKEEDFDVAFHAFEQYHKYYVKLNDLKAERSINEAMQNEYTKTINRLEAIAKVGRELTTLSNVDDVLFEVKDILSKLMDINGIGIGEVVDDRIEFNHFLVEGLKIDQSEVLLSDTHSLAAWSVNNNKEVQVNDIEKDFELYVKGIVRLRVDDGNTMKTENTQSVLYAPLKVKGETIGVFTIQSFKKNAFLTEEFEIFRIIVAYVAIAFKNAKQSMVLEQQAITDSLTLINNRKGFTDYYEAMIKSEEIRNVSIIMMDLDYFKKINDNYSHVAGDTVLIEIGKILKSKEDDMIISARLGGEEFGFILFNKSGSFVLEFAESVRSEIEMLEIPYKDMFIQVTTSIGITSDNYKQELDFKRLYFEADKALLKAKTDGRNQVVSYKNI